MMNVDQKIQDKECIQLPQTRLMGFIQAIGSPCPFPSLSGLYRSRFCRSRVGA